MNARKLLPRLAILVGSALFVIVVVYFVCPGQREMTLGTLATKEPGQPAGYIRVSNCVGSTQTGRFLTFPSSVKARHTVVFVLTSNRPQAKTQTHYAGYCEGVCNFDVPGCPVAPPFLLVTDVTPIPQD